MRLRGLAIFPFVFAAAFIALAMVLEGPARTQFVLWQKILVRTLAIIGTVAACRAFNPGDRLRQGWAWIGISTAIFLARDLIRLTDYFGPRGPGGSHWLFPVSVLAGNLALVIGTWVLARSWKVAATMGGASRQREFLASIVAILLAIAVAGPALYDSTRDFVTGERQAIALMASALGDIVSLALVAPILLIAIHMRRGLLVWPWGLLAASRFAWLLFDAATLVGPTWTPGFPLHELFRGLGENLLFSAGLAQAFVLAQLRLEKH